MTAIGNSLSILLNSLGHFRPQAILGVVTALAFSIVFFLPPETLGHIVDTVCDDYFRCVGSHHLPKISQLGVPGATSFDLIHIHFPGNSFSSDEPFTDNLHTHLQ